MSLYEVLGVSKESSQDEIKKAYKKLALKHHPDKNIDKEKNCEEFKKITEAYNVLSDEHKRAEYDQFGTVGDNNFNGPNMNMFNINEMIRNMFNMHMRPDPQTQAQTYQIMIPLEIVMNGGTKIVDYSVKCLCTTCQGRGAIDPKDIINCMTCGGKGSISQQLNPFMVINSTCSSCFGNCQVIKNGKQCSTCKGEKLMTSQRSYNLNIPKGIKNNTTFKLDEKGDWNPEIKKHNDMHLIFTYDVPNHVVVHNKDVTIKIDISLSDLLNGFKKRIDIYGSSNIITLISNNYFNPTKSFIFKGKGLVKDKENDRGQLCIVFNVLFPETIHINKNNFTKEEKDGDIIIIN